MMATILSGQSYWFLRVAALWFLDVFWEASALGKPF